MASPGDGDSSATTVSAEGVSWGVGDCGDRVGLNGGGADAGTAGIPAAGSSDERAGSGAAAVGTASGIAGEVSVGVTGRRNIGSAACVAPLPPLSTVSSA